MQIITIKTPTVVLYSQVNIAWHQLFLEVSEEEVQCDGDYFFSLSLGQFYLNCSNKARLLRMQRGGGGGKKTAFICYWGVANEQRC